VALNRWRYLYRRSRSPDHAVVSAGTHRAGQAALESRGVVEVDVRDPDSRHWRIKAWLHRFCRAQLQ